MTQKVYIGNTSIEKLSIVLQEFLSQTIFLVRGKKSYELCGAKRVIEDTVRKLKCKVVEFDDFSENPKIEDVEKGLNLLSLSKANIILAVGGGSVLDMAKLIRFFHSYSGNPTGIEFKKENKILPLIVLPTTAGTGSEATHFAVLYKNQIKYSVAHDDILPNIAIICPTFTYNNLKYLTACTGFDALSQSIEAYWNVNATEESDEYAMKAISLIWTNLLLVLTEPTNELKDKISEGAYWAGKAINITKTTAPHAFSYPFTSYYGYPHGHAVAMTFPFFWKKNVLEQSNLSYKIDKECYRLKMMRLRSITDDNIVDYIDKIGLSLSLPIDFRKELILDNVNIDRLSNNPVVLTKDDYINIFA